MPISTINNKSIADGTVIAADILDGTISSSKLVSANIAGDRIAANTLSNTVFQTGSVESYLRGANLDFGMRNRIINGAMVISQRNGTSSVTPTDGQYVLDRWKQLQAASAKYSVQQNAGSVAQPAGFTNYLGVTSLSSYSVGSSEYFLTTQVIEGFNIADLNFGNANARPVTLSFFVRSSLTGTFGGAMTNGSNTRAYPFSYTIVAANTWERKSITIAGDTSGSWSTDNSAGIQIKFGLGVGSSLSGTAGAWVGSDIASVTGAVSVVGTNAATWYITGVQLEEGSVATSYEYRQTGTELQLCQRYYEKSYEPTVVPGTNTALGITYQYTGRNVSNLYGIYHTRFRVDKRGTPTVVLYTLTGTAGQISDNDSGSNVGAATIYYQSTTGFLPVNNSGGTLTAAALGWHYTASSEL